MALWEREMWPRPGSPLMERETVNGANPVGGLFLARTCYSFL